MPDTAPPDTAADTKTAEVEATVRELMKLAQVVEAGAAGAGNSGSGIPWHPLGIYPSLVAVPRLGETSPKLFGGQSTYNDLQVGCSRL